jgi:putative ABC transport system ATP-binding protein
MTNNILVSIKDLKFKYPDQDSWVLNISDFSISEGEKVFLHGPSGCGKSTLLEILSGILKPEAGRVRISNCKLEEMSNSERDRFRAENLSYIFQSFNLIPYLSAKDNILLPLGFSKSQIKKISDDELFYLTDKLGISSLLEKRPSALSVGQQQRVAAARALICKPKLILADEPTSALDQDRREKFIEIFFELTSKNHTSVIFVSHDKTLASLFDRSVNFFDINNNNTSIGEAGLA